KKDMGGAAHALALAELVMARRLPLRLTLLVPAVENAVGPDAFRPGEVVATRTGVTVEIDNTDAEGRVILGDALAYAGAQVRDPLWRMPLWRPYLRYLTSKVADLANAGSKMAGSVTAALYLERFVPGGTPWAHLDTYAWNDSDRPGRPAGGEALGLRAA